MQSSAKLVKGGAGNIQEFRKKPILYILRVRENQYRMRSSLNTPYDVVDGAVKLQFQSKLGRLAYGGAVLTDYFAVLEDIFN